LHRRRQWHCSAAAGEAEPDITDEEAAEMAAAFKKMMEDGIGDELPEMPEASEVCCYGIRHGLQVWTIVMASCHKQSAGSHHPYVAPAAPGAVAAGSGAGDGNGQLAPERSAVICNRLQTLQHLQSLLQRLVLSPVRPRST
jgi:hypothetical protein